jgi:hypothetical protein
MPDQCANRVPRAPSQTHAGEMRLPEVRRVRCHLPATVSLANLLLAQPLAACVLADQRGVHKQQRVLNLLLIDPGQRFREADRPSRAEDPVRLIQGDHAGISGQVCIRPFTPREVDAQEDHLARIREGADLVALSGSIPAS